MDQMLKKPNRVIGPLVTVIFLSFELAYPQISKPGTQPCVEPVAPMRSPAFGIPMEWSGILASASRNASVLQKKAPTADLGRKIQAELRAVERTLAKANRIAPTNREAMANLLRDVHAHEIHLAKEMKQLENLMEELRNRKQMATSEYQHLDQAVNQTMQAMARVIRTLGEMRKSGVASRSGM